MKRTLKGKGFVPKILGKPTGSVFCARCEAELVEFQSSLVSIVSIKEKTYGNLSFAIKYFKHLKIRETYAYTK